MIYALVRMLAIVQSSWALHCSESTKSGQGECHTEFFIDYHSCSGDLRSRTSSHKGNPIYTSGSELAIECSSSECLEDPNLFLTARREGMTSLEKEAVKCFDELVKDGRLKKAVEKISKNREMEVEVPSDSSVEELEYNADELTQNPSENVRQPRQAGSSSPGRGKKDKGSRQTTEPTISSSKKPRKRRPWHEKLFQNTKAVRFAIIYTLATMLSLTLLMQLFLLIYLCRVQSNYVLLWRGALPEHGSRTPVESEPNTSSTETEDPEKDRKPPSDATSASKSVSAPPGDGDNVPSALHSEQTPAVDPYLR